MQEVYHRASAVAPPLPRSFLEKRLQSLAGLFLVLFLFEHLLTNSQAALFVGDDGLGFIQAVDFIKSLPYLPVIELTLIGFPLVLHGWFGLRMLLTSSPNSVESDGTTPALPYLSRNQAYTWQRITSLILVVGLILHVGNMRFLRYPETAHVEGRQEYLVRVTDDPGLIPVCKRLGVDLLVKAHEERYVVTSSFGTAVLFTVRDVFKSIWHCVLYTLFVLATCFHALNGIWTFSITWGVALNERSRGIVRKVSNGVMALLVFLGLAAIWGTYFINLRS